MRRFLAVTLVFCFLLGLTACGKAPADSADGTLGTTQPSQIQDLPTEETTPNKYENNISPTEGTKPEATAPTVSVGNTDPTESATPTVPVTPTTPTVPTTPTTPTLPNTPHTHSYTGKVTKAAGCSAKGIKTFICPCGSSYTQDIPATGHSWGAWVTVKPASTTETGKSQRKCGNCSATENKTIEKLPAPVPESSAVTQAQLDQIYDIFLDLVNEERTRVGVTTLTANSYLDSVAQIRSNETITLFSHTRPDGQPWSTVVDAQSYPYTTIGENLCMTSHVGDGAYTYADKWVGSQTQIEAAAGWLFILFKNSPGHYANMIEADFEECGIGISCQMYQDTDIPMFYLAHIFGAR